MNYMLEIKAFNDFLVTHKLSTGQIALWYALMEIFNRCYWPEYASIPSSALKLRTSLSVNAVKEARDKLVEAGLIQVKTRGTKTVTYKMNSVIEINKIMYTTIQDSVTNSVKTISNSVIVESEKPYKHRAAKYPKTYKTKTYNIYNTKKGKYNDYSQREYEERVFELYYTN